MATLGRSFDYILCMNFGVFLLYERLLGFILLDGVVVVINPAGIYGLELVLR
jgi:hypothetical protein